MLSKILHYLKNKTHIIKYPFLYKLNNKQIDHFHILSLLLLDLLDIFEPGHRWSRPVHGVPGRAHRGGHRRGHQRAASAGDCPCVHDTVCGRGGRSGLHRASRGFALEGHVRRAGGPAAV